MTRREFLVRTAAGLTVPAWAGSHVLAAAALQPERGGGKPRPIRIGVVGADDVNAATKRGLQFGREEAERVASLLGTRLEVVALDPATLARSAETLESQASRAALRETSDALLVRDPVRDAVALDAGPPVVAFARHDTPQPLPAYWSVRVPAHARVTTAVRVLAQNAGARRWGVLVDRDVREDNAGALQAALKDHAEEVVFTRGTPVPVAVGDINEVDALVVAGASASAPDIRRRLGEAARDRTWLVRIPLDAEVEESVLGPREACDTEWHHELERFGAGELNERYERRFGDGAGMDADAWGAWLAVRIVVDATLRARSAGQPHVEPFIASGRFDGHKGVALTFGTPDGQRWLRQPLYVLARPGHEPGPVLWEEPS